MICWKLDNQARFFNFYLLAANGYMENTDSLNFSERISTNSSSINSYSSGISGSDH
jgi:hypothetical protein